MSAEGTILEVRRGFIKVALPRKASDALEMAGVNAMWRMDRYSPDTTYQRQLKVNMPRSPAGTAACPRMHP